MNWYSRTVPDNVTRDNEQLVMDSATSNALYPVNHKTMYKAQYFETMTLMNQHIPLYSPVHKYLL